MDEACSWVKDKVPEWGSDDQGIREMVKHLECFPLAVAQAAEYVCLYHTVTPAKYLDELKYAGLTRGKSWMKSGEYTEYKFPECL